MTYTLKGSWVCDSLVFVPPTTFNKPCLAIKATLPNAKTTWNKAADIYQFVELPGVGKLTSSKRVFLPLGRLIEISLPPASEEYQLQLELPIWIKPTDVTLTIYENDMPTFSELTPVAQSNDFANKLVTAVAASTTVANVAANPLRKGLLVRNRGTNTVYIGLNDPAVTAATASVALVGGNTWEPGEDVFTGILHFITASGTTNINVTELMS